MTTPSFVSARSAALLLIATAALAIAGCGGDDETTSSTGASGATGVSGTPLSEEEFVSQADAICATVNSRIEGLQAPRNDLASIADFAQQGLEIVQPALQELQALVPPEDLQAQFDDYVSRVEDQVDLQDQLGAAAAAGDTEEVDSLIEQLQAGNNNEAARDLGLNECAKDASPQG
jgi:hypothetical protein